MAKYICGFEERRRIWFVASDCPHALDDNREEMTLQCKACGRQDCAIELERECLEEAVKA